MERPSKTALLGAPALSELDKQLLNDFQRDLPLSSRPYAEMARRLGISEQEVIERLRILREKGAVSRVGAVIRPHTVGASTLAAMTVPAERLPEVAALVSSYPEVNHNYEREHRFNLWFVATAPDAGRLHDVLRSIERRTGLAVLDLPLLEDYHIDLGFNISWN